MKKIASYMTLLLCATVFSASMHSCGGDGGQTKDGGAGEAVVVESEENLPINVTVLIDLSDRLTRDNVTPSQMENDTSIINHIVKLFKAECMKDGKMPACKNSMQVLFYPAPKNQAIPHLAKNMKVDLSKLKPAEKRIALKEIGPNYAKSLKAIYDETIDSKQWVGSDIWGFFNNGKVDNYCIKQGYRNILVLLTDGYIYHQDNKIVDGKAFSYVLPRTLAIDGSSLLVKRKKPIENLEILMLEVNPYSPAQHDRLFEVLTAWFTEMGIDETDLVITETDVETNTEHVIDSFFNK